MVSVMPTSSFPTRIRTGVSNIWKRTPAIVRRAGFVLLAYNGYQYMQRIDTLYKLSSPGRHTLGSTVLDLDLTSLELVAHDGRRSRSPFTAGDQASIPRVVALLRAARDDPRVAGLVCRGISGLRGAGLADVTELRRAVCGFSEGLGGKPSVLHVPEGLGLAQNGTVPLYFASAFDSAHVMPTSAVLVPGLSFASLFFKGTLEKLGVTPIKVARKEYKTAVNSFTEEGYTEPHRESTQALMDSILEVLTKGIAEGRGLKEKDVAEAFDEAILTAPQAVERGLIDACAYRDELPDIMRQHLASGVQERYKARVAVDKEWREAMTGLVDAWKDVKEWGLELAQMDSLLSATQFATHFVRTGLRSRESDKFADAELRALKAHLAWLETRPWEGVPRAERLEHFPVGHAFSLIELEKRLCVEAIRAHEHFPLDAQTLKEIAEKNKGSVKVADLKKVVRWVRALWRGKALCVRMVGSLSDAPDPKEKIEKTDVDETDVVDGKTTIKPNASEKSMPLGGPAAPRFFLLHQAGSPALPSIPPEEKTVDYVEMSKSKTHHVDRLRYMALAEYQHLVSAESSAGESSRRSWWREIDSRPQLTTIHGARESEYFGGVVDASERTQLSYLADHGLTFLDAWRLNSTRTSPTVAVVHVDGAISDEGCEELRGAIRRASKDSEIDAIVVRVDSPGGSASASDLISRAVEVSKKPIVCSMANICASGGLFIAVPADKVFCEEATITGSCGVIFSGFLPIGLFEKLGVTVDTVNSNKFSKYFGSAGLVTEWDAEYKGRIDTLIDDMYKSFVTAVSRGRGMAYDEVEAIARGRVWSGIDAKRVGLVDEFGGLEDAAACAAELAGGEPGVRPALVSYPSVGMRLESRLKALGVIRSRLDEEGDEEAPREKKRGKPRAFSFTRLLTGDDDDDDDLEDDVTDSSEAQDGKGETKDIPKKDGDGDGDGDGGDDPTSITDLTIRPEPEGLEDANVPSNSLGSLSTPFAGISGPQAFLISAAESWLDFRDSCVSSCALWCLGRLEDNLMSPNPSPVVSKMADYLLDSVYSRSGISAAVAAELQAAAVTSGRPAMVMTPQIHSNIESVRSTTGGR